MVVSIVTDHSTPSPPVSRGKALHYIEEVEQQFDRIVSVALAAIAYEESLSKDARNAVLANLFDTIKGKADGGAAAISELRKMFEAQPAEANQVLSPHPHP